MPVFLRVTPDGREVPYREGGHFYAMNMIIGSREARLTPLDFGTAQRRLTNMPVTDSECCKLKDRVQMLETVGISNTASRAASPGDFPTPRWARVRLEMR